MEEELKQKDKRNMERVKKVFQGLLIAAATLFVGYFVCLAVGTANERRLYGGWEMIEESWQIETKKSARESELFPRSIAFLPPFFFSLEPKIKVHDGERESDPEWLGNDAWSRNFRCDGNGIISSYDGCWSSDETWPVFATQRIKFRDLGNDLCEMEDENGNRRRYQRVYRLTNWIHWCF